MSTVRKSWKVITEAVNTNKPISIELRTTPISDQGAAHHIRLPRHMSLLAGRMLDGSQVRISAIARTTQQIGVFHRPRGPNGLLFNPRIATSTLKIRRVSGTIHMATSELGTNCKGLIRTRTRPHDLCYCTAMSHKNTTQADTLHTKDDEALHDNCSSYNKRKDFGGMYGS